MIQTAHQIVALASDPNASQEALKQAGQALFNQLPRTPPPTAAQALEVLAEALSVDDLQRAAFVAMVSGALVEAEIDPRPLIRPLFARVQPLFAQARVFHDACSERAAADEEELEEKFAEVAHQLAEEMPDEAAAWSALEQFFPPLIAVLSVSAEARREGQPLAEDAEAIRPFHEAGQWVAQILQVLDDEPCLVLEPATNQGMLGRFHGISLNFQLNVLLMDVFPQPSRWFGLFRQRRVSQSAADVARGRGPQQTEETLTSCWNLYAWTAVGADRQLPDPNDFASSDHWIWNEGVPGDIPVFEGYRVILLGPPSYPRSWRSQRDFDALKADLTLEKALSRDEVRAWLDRFATADRS